MCRYIWNYYLKRMRGGHWGEFVELMEECFKALQQIETQELVLLWPVQPLIRKNRKNLKSKNRKNLVYTARTLNAAGPEQENSVAPHANLRAA